ncbi:hypothetical protein PYW08_007495 [Mythimna loreyi]|uniref:Uncharacterized protein n=1 Tax=Mythimna loreyi TaxID=667449 RepID=A0ACC2QDW2_9NEOP|nr:hypothetical protein PYW08_007495 [Mythimna loreyi]
MILCFTSAVFCVDACCAMLCCERQRTLLWLPTGFRPLGGAPMAAVRALAVLAAGAAGAQGLVLHVLLAALRAGPGVRAPSDAAAPHHAAPLAAARALVAMRTCAAAGGAGAHGPRLDVNVCVDVDVSGWRRCRHLIGS